MANEVRLKELAQSALEVNVALSHLYAERARIHKALFSDPDVGPTLMQGGEFEVGGFKVWAQKMRPEECSPFEQKELPKADTGHLLKLKVSALKKKD